MATKARVALLGAAFALFGALACSRGDLRPMSPPTLTARRSRTPNSKRIWLPTRSLTLRRRQRVLSSLFDQFLEELLLARLATDEGFQAGSSRVAVARVISESSKAVERAEVEAFFRANPEQFRRAESVRLRQILGRAARNGRTGSPRSGCGSALRGGCRETLGGATSQAGR